MRSMGYGRDYKYAHDFEGGTVEQQHLPVREHDAATLRAHHRQRRWTARLFASAVVQATYRPLMERQAAALADELVRRRRLDVAELSLRMTVQVGCQVVGLTNSILRRRLPRRIDRLVGVEVVARGWRPGQLVGLLRMQLPALAFFLLDVLPAIAARRRRRATHDDMRDLAISEGKPLTSSSALIGGYEKALPIQIPMIDIFEVGTGGGS